MEPVAFVTDACRVCLNTLERVSNLFSCRFSLLTSILSLLQTVLQSVNVLGELARLLLCGVHPLRERQHLINRIAGSCVLFLLPVGLEHIPSQGDLVSIVTLQPDPQGVNHRFANHGVVMPEEGALFFWQTIERRRGGWERRHLQETANALPDVRELWRWLGVVPLQEAGGLKWSEL